MDTTLNCTIIELNDVWVYIHRSSYKSDIHNIELVCIGSGIWNRDIFDFAFTAFIFAASCTCNFFETSKGIEICKIFAIYLNVKRAKTLSAVMCAMCTYMYVCVVVFLCGCLYGVVIFNTENIRFICIKYIIIPSFTKSWLLWYFCCCCDDLRKVSFSETYCYFVIVITFPIYI